MATADEYAAWMAKNANRKGTPDFEIVASAYRDSKLAKPATGGFDLSTAKPVTSGFDLSTAQPWDNDPIVKRAGSNPWDNDPIIKRAPNIGTAQGDGMRDKIAKAKAAGYTNDQIAEHLGGMPGFGDKMNTAKAAGYKSDEIINHLASGTATAAATSNLSTPPKNPRGVMPSREELYTALRNADKAGDVEGARKLAAYIQAQPSDGVATLIKPEPSMLDSLGSGIKKVAQGAAMGVSDIGNTVLNAATYLPGKVIPEVAQWNRTRNADFDAITEQNKDSTAFKGGRLAGNIAATLPVGGALASGVRTLAPLALRAGASAPVIEGLANAVSTGGFTTRMPAAATIGAKAANLGIRATGGAITGGASSGLINQDDTATGAAIGGILPTVLGALGPMGSYLGRAAASVVQPFTTKGQEAIAGRIVKKFAEGGPTAINARQLVPGSMPTLAEATGNAGLATFQRGVRDMNPNAFVAREAQNAGARNALFDNIAGDTTKLNVAKDARESVANVLYKKAADSDAMRREMTQADAVRQAALDFGRRGGMGTLKTAEATAADSILPSGALQDLNSRGTFRAAVQSAKKLAENKGQDIGNPLTSINGLHYVKLAIDDMLEPSATNSLARNAKSGLMDTKNRLMDEIEKLSPQYGTARSAFQDMSQPINSMEALQGLRLTDAQGNITLAKVKNAIEGLERARNAPGVSPAKAIDAAQMDALQAIHADLLRQAALGAGRSAGSNTFQNIATNNILSSLLPGKLGEVAGNKVGSFVGQVGRLAYSGPNEAIRNKLMDMALQPELAAGALGSAGPRIPGRFNALLEASAPTLYRAAPALSTSR
jgi:hypothetical protein